MTIEPTNVSEGLEPCPTPWCDPSGGLPYVFTRRRDCFGVYCPSCSVTTPYFRTAGEAIEVWNTRVSPPLPSPGVERLVEVMGEALCAQSASLRDEGLFGRGETEFITRYEAVVSAWDRLTAALSALPLDGGLK